MTLDPNDEFPFRVPVDVEQNDADPAGPKKVLLIMHRHESQSGNVGRWLRKHGFELDIRRPRFGDPLPATLAGHAGAVLFGGPMSANDSDDYIKTEIDWLAVPLKEKKPYFGICLGAQMLAKHLGGKVGCHEDALVEVGYYPILPNQAGQNLLQWPRQVYQWHTEGFSLPSGAEPLASGQTFANQAFRFGDNAYGVQFHPEMTLAMIHRWTVSAAHRLSAPGAKPRADHISEHHMHGAPLRDWLDQFMRLWLKIDPHPAAAGSGLAAKC